MTMMMGFDFGGNNLGAATSSNATLAPYEIHDVKFRGLTFGASKDGKWEFMRMKFQGQGGWFTDSHFGFDPAEKKSHEREQGRYGLQASKMENLMLKTRHLVAAIAPDLYDKMVNKEITFTPKSKKDLFKQYVEWLGGLLEEYDGVETQIKLVANKKGESVFPGFYSNVSDAGVAELKTNFIGKNISLTSAEKTARENFKSASPTNMGSKVKEAKGEFDMDLDSSSEAPAAESTEGTDTFNMKF